MKKIGIIIDSINIFLIFSTIIILIIEKRFSIFYETNINFLSTLEYIIIFLFAADLMYRLFFLENPKRYITSISGIIDVIAIVPSLFGIFFGSSISTAWLRALRIFRLLRIGSISYRHYEAIGVIARVLPFLMAAVALKGLAVAHENEPWWPDIGNINTVLGVVGFSLAITMGAKLSVVNGRIYAIEDAICRIVGAMRDMEKNKNISEALWRWSRDLHSTLICAKKEKYEAARQMRLKTDGLEAELELENIGGPNTAGFHRDVAFLLHRITATTPVAYEQFIRIILVIYSLTLILVVPGITGLFCSALVTLALGGLFFLVDDMDSPLEFSKDSLVDVRLDALEQFNEARTISQG